MPGKNQVEGKCDTDNIKAQNDHLPDKIVIKQEKQDNDEQLSVVNREHCESLAQVWIKEEQEEFNEHLIIKDVQSTEFGDEFSLLSKGQQLPKTSKLAQLCPFVDSEGVIPVGGRLADLNIPAVMKHPPILITSHPAKSI